MLLIMAVTTTKTITTLLTVIVACGQTIADDTPDGRLAGRDAYERPGFVDFKLKPWYGGSFGAAMRSFKPVPGARYVAGFYVRLLNDDKAALGQLVQQLIKIEYSDKSPRYVKTANHLMATSKQGWFKVQGDFKVDSGAIKSVSLKVQGPWSSVRFEVKDGTIERMWEGDWRAHSDKVINQIRKNNINFRVTTGNNVKPSEVKIEIYQTRKSFPLGTAVNPWKYVVPGNQRYRDFIHNHFSWAVDEAALQWTHVEPTANVWQNRYSLPQSVAKALQQAGLKMRGHSLIWSKDWAPPGWVKKLDKPQTRRAVEDHIHHAMDHMKGLVEHWDVNNENLHGFYFQEKLGDLSYELEPFRIAHQHDPKVKLFLNDYDIVAHGESTSAYVSQARRLRQAGVGLYGLGVQCHYFPEEAPDPLQIKNRLDRLAETGLPIWVTEFNIVSKNGNTRASMVETAMRAFYGHPAVEGILLWGFWDGALFRGPDAALVDGNEFKLNAAGSRFLSLWEKEWLTRETHSLSTSNQSLTVRAFHGDYRVKVFYQGKELSQLQQTFSLGKTDQTITIHVPGRAPESTTQTEPGNAI